MKSSPSRPPKPPKPARRSTNPFVDDDEEDEGGITLTLSPIRVGPSFASTTTRNPFVSTNPFDKEADLEAGQQVELRFVSTNPFDGDDEKPSRSPGLIQSLTSSFRPSPSPLPAKPAAPAPVRLPRFAGRHSGYDAFRTESVTSSPLPAAGKQKREDADQVAARIASANQRQKVFLLSLAIKHASTSQPMCCD